MDKYFEVIKLSEGALNSAIKLITELSWNF